MGRETALNPAKAGHRVTAYDVRREAVDALASAAIRAAAICVTRPGAQASMPSREEVERSG